MATSRGSLKTHNFNPDLVKPPDSGHFSSGAAQVTLHAVSKLTRHFCVILPCGCLLHQLLFSVYTGGTERSEAEAGASRTATRAVKGGTPPYHHPTRYATRDGQLHHTGVAGSVTAETPAGGDRKRLALCLLLVRTFVWGRPSPARGSRR